MKKLFVLILTLVAIAVSVAGSAYAETAENKICEIAVQNEKVTDAKCIVYRRVCILAIKTEKFTTKSEYDAYVDEITETIKNDCEVDTVVVTRNPKVMNKLSKLAQMPEEQRNAEIEKMIERELGRGERPEHKIPPKMLQA